MTTPIDDEGFDVELRLQPVVARPQGWRGRSSSMVAVGLVLFVAGALVLGTAFDDGRPTSPPQAAIADVPSKAPSARPSTPPTPSPRPLATPLPVREVFGTDLPSERRFVYANSFAMLDLATGEVSPLGRLSNGWSLPLPLPNGELVCACLDQDISSTATGSSAVRKLRFGRYDPSGAPILEKDLVSFDEVAGGDGSFEPLSVSATVDPDFGAVYALVSERRPTEWVVSLHVIDVASGELRSSVELDRLPVAIEGVEPSPSPRTDGGTPDGIYLWSAGLAVTPGGRSVFALVARSEVRNDNWTTDALEWMVDLPPGKPATPTRLEPPASLASGSWCVNEPAFVDAELFVQVCGDFANAAGGFIHVRRIRPDGEALDDVPLDVADFDGSAPMSVVLDRAHRAVFVWNLRSHVLVRVDVDDGRITSATVPAAMLEDAGRSPIGRGYGRGYVGGDPGLVLAPDGSRLYALGVTGAGDGAAGRPSGIWVFDSETMDLAGHWEPRAFLSSLAVSADGRFVYAAGAPGLDVEGRDNPWPASVTVYDAISGEIQVIFGAVAQDSWLTFFRSP